MIFYGFPLAYALFLLRLAHPRTHLPRTDFSAKRARESSPPPTLCVQRELGGTTLLREGRQCCVWSRGMGYEP